VVWEVMQMLWVEAHLYREVPNYDDNGKTEGPDESPEPKMAASVVWPGVFNTERINVPCPPPGKPAGGQYGKS
jgi:hypothetical protein